MRRGENISRCIELHVLSQWNPTSLFLSRCCLVLCRRTRLCPDINTAGHLSVRLKMSLNEGSLAVEDMFMCAINAWTGLIPTVFKELINCTYDELLACLLHCKRCIRLLMNEIMACHIQYYSITVTPMIKYLELLRPCWIGAQPFGFRADVLLRTGRCIYCKLNCFILCVFYTVDFFDIFCIHCDQMAQEVLVLGIVKTCVISHLCTQLSFFLC